MDKLTYEEFLDYLKASTIGAITGGIGAGIGEYFTILTVSKYHSHGGEVLTNTKTVQYIYNELNTETISTIAKSPVPILIIGGALFGAIFHNHEVEKGAFIGALTGGLVTGLASGLQAGVGLFAGNYVATGMLLGSVIGGAAEYAYDNY